LGQGYAALRDGVPALGQRHAALHDGVPMPGQCHAALHDGVPTLGQYHAALHDGIPTLGHIHAARHAHFIKYCHLFGSMFHYISINYINPVHDIIIKKTWQKYEISEYKKYFFDFFVFFYHRTTLHGKFYPTKVIYVNKVSNFTCIIRHTVQLCV
jgi:hypothetical protein